MPSRFEKKPEMFGRLAELPIPPLEYYDLIRQFNNLIQDELAEQLKERVGILGPAVTLVTMGSDGRREKGSLASPLEIMALTDAELDPAVLKKTIVSVLEQTPLQSTKISKIVEIKTPGTTLAFFNNDPHRVQPGRVADSHLVYGVAESLVKIKRRLGEEILSLPRKTIVERVEGLEKDARKTTLHGKNRIGGNDAIHFDLENGVVYFNPDAGQLSFKIGPLRLVQSTLLAEAVKHTRREGDANFIGTLALGIVKRLGQLSEDRMLNLAKNSVGEIAEHYAFFLRMYHRSEQAYSQNKEMSVRLEKSDTEEIAKRLAALMELMSKFKIQRPAK